MTPIQNWFTPDSLPEEVSGRLFALSNPEMKQAIPSTYFIDNEQVERLGKLYYQVVTHPEHTFEEKIHVLGELRESTPFYIVMDRMLQKEPLHFLHVLQHIPNEECRKNLFQWVIQHSYSFPYEDFLTLFQVAAGDEIQPGLREKTYQLILTSIPEEDRGEFLSLLLSRSTPEENDSFFYSIKSESLAHCLAISWYHLHAGNDSFHDKCREFVRGIVRTAMEEESDPPMILKAMLKIMSDKEVLNLVFLNQDLIHDEVTIGYLMWSIPDEALQAFASDCMEQNKEDLLAQWTDHFFDLTLSPRDRLLVTKNVFATINLQESLRLLKSFIAYGSEAAGYFCAAIPEETLDSITGYSPDHRGDILDYCLPLTAEESEVIIGLIHQDETRLKQFTESMQTDIPPQTFDRNVLLYRNFSMKELGEFIELTLSQEEGKSNMEAFQSDLQTVPPFLIALVTPIASYRNWIMKVLVYLTDDQIQGFAQMIPTEELIPCMNQAIVNIQNHQLSNLLLHLSDEHSILYSQHKAKEYLAMIDPMETEMRILIEKIQEHSPTESDLEEYQKLEKDCFSILSQLRSYESYFWTKIESLLENDMQMEFLKAKGRYHALLERFHGEEGLISQVESLAPKVEEEEGISDSYWELITQNVLVHLNIEHAGKIFDHGIRSDKDFEKLGLSHERRMEIDQIQMAISNLGITEENALEIKKGWDDLLNTALSEPEKREEKLIALIEKLDLREQVANLLPHLEAIKNNKYSTEGEQQIAEYHIFSLSKPLGDQPSLDSETAIKFIINYVVNHSFLVRLQKHLKS